MGLRSWLSGVYRPLRAELRAASLRRSLDVHQRSDVVAIGGLSYGGYRVPIGMLTADSVVYSIGVGENTQFDLELIKRVGCAIHAMGLVCF